jgi:hypothetical protein
MKHVRTTQLAEHSASRPTDLQIPKATGVFDFGLALPRVPMAVRANQRPGHETAPRPVFLHLPRPFRVKLRNTRNE